jgi:hypothetical protein
VQGRFDLGTVTVFGWGAGMVRLENSSSGGTVLVGKCVSSQYGFHSVKRAVVVRVWLRNIVSWGTVLIMQRCRFVFVWVGDVVQLHVRFDSSSSIVLQWFRVR